MTRALYFQRPGLSILKIDSLVVERLLAFRQDDGKKLEAGGVLMGRLLKGSSNVVIDENTEPMTGDARSPCAFERSAHEHQEMLDARWSESAGTCGYLGEWHTHPEPHPTPSSVDLRDWRRRLKQDRFDVAHLFFIIVGIQTISAWQGERGRTNIEYLTPTEQPHLPPLQPAKRVVARLASALRRRR
jgi:integrative and conjugative element protein (TIGR02256 family)